jgi:hypothetical protein
MLIEKRLPGLLCFILATWSSIPQAAPLQRLQAVDSLKIADVWSGHPVDFAFVQHGDSHYVAYYDSERKMSVAARGAASRTVSTFNLPSTIGWDSHNYIAMALDSAGFIHVSGNMHNAALVYFRSTAPNAINSLKSATMVGTLENSITYPVFFNGPSKELLYMYRDGGSGNGNQIFNRWNSSTGKWSRLFDKALFDGQGQRNAYMGGPILGPDGYFHVYWMWRETADAATTHDVGYIKSKDLQVWESAAGVRLTLPVTASTPGVLVDTIPQRGGVINRGAIGFDSRGRVIVTYHKFDAAGNTQLYNARWENGSWKKYAASTWAYRWDFGGTGSLVMKISFGPVETAPGGALTQSYSHVQYGSGIWQLNEATLQPESNVGTSLWPVGLEQPRRQGMVVHWLKSTGLISMAGTFLNSTSTPPDDPATVYALRWETMPENQDQPRSPIPASTPLMLYTFKDPNVSTGIAAARKSAGNAPAPLIRINANRVKINNHGGGSSSVIVSDLAGRTLLRAEVQDGETIDLHKFCGRGIFPVTVAVCGKAASMGIVVR